MWDLSPKTEEIVSQLRDATPHEKAEIVQVTHQYLMERIMEIASPLTVERLGTLSSDQIEILTRASFAIQPSLVLKQCGPEALLAMGVLRTANHMSSSDLGRHDFADAFTGETGSPFNVYNFCLGNAIFSRRSLGEGSSPYVFDSGAVRVVQGSRTFAALGSTAMAEIFEEALSASNASSGIKKQHSIVSTWGAPIHTAHVGRDNLLDEMHSKAKWQYSPTEERRIKIDLDGSMGIVLAVRQCPIAVLGFSMYQQLTDDGATKVGLVVSQLQGTNPRDEQGELLETRHNICREWREILVHAVRIVGNKLGFDETLIVKSSHAPWDFAAAMECKHLDIGAANAGFTPPAHGSSYWRELRDR